MSDNYIEERFEERWAKKPNQPFASQTSNLALKGMCLVYAKLGAQWQAERTAAALDACQSRNPDALATAIKAASDEANGVHGGDQ